MKALVALPLLLLASCIQRKAPEPEEKEELEPGLAAVECLRKVQADGDTDLSGDFGIQLCSGATDPDAPLRCFDEARRELDRDRALMLCSPRGSGAPPESN